MSKVALVTGASGGIGRALVAAFAQAGYAVVGTDLVASEPRSGARFTRLDLADPEAPRRLIDEIARSERRLDVIVNNAAVQIVKPAAETTHEEWDRLMAVNLRAPFLLARFGQPLLGRQGGAVVNIASVHASATSPGLSAYAASKGGLVALTRALAVEFGREGIRVNAILPGAVDTPMLEAGLGRGHLEGTSVETRKSVLAERTPIPRLAGGDDVARTALFLADGQLSGFITGQTLTVDGGALARLSTE